MVYRLLVYNIDNQSSNKFDISQADSFGWAVNGDFLGSFSPNDSNFMCGNPKYYVAMMDSSLKPIPTILSVYGTVDYDVQGAYPQWSSDTSFVFLSTNRSIIAEYFLKSGRIDTLVSITNNEEVLGFAYNLEYEILAYSVTNYDHSTRRDPSLIYFHYKNSDNDSLIYSPLRDHPEDEPCWTAGYRGIISLSWSPDNKNLSFLGFQFFDLPGAGIYIYSLDSNRTYKATECNGITGYRMRWANNDTLIYVDAHYLLIYGMDVSSISTSVEQELEDELITEFNISNYPNPFNPTTVISYQLSGTSKVRLKIYDTLGREITTLIDNEMTAGEHKTEFDARRYNLSSGAYYYELKINNHHSVKKMMVIK